MSPITLRPERPADRRAVERLTYEAFLTAEVGGDTEALLARKLRHAASFIPELDLVAVADGAVVGNIMYTRSRVVGAGGQWPTCTFGPISVAPAVQRRGVGTALITRTLDLARGMGFRAVVIFGNPAYYARFGFRPASGFGITLPDGVTFDAFMALPLFDGALDDVAGVFHDDPVFAGIDPAEAERFNDLQRMAGMSLVELWQLFPIQLRPHNPAYPQWFAAQAAELRTLFGKRAARISHIGSTAVPGLVAKPIVDILLELDPATDHEPDPQPDIPPQAEGSPGSDNRETETIVDIPLELDPATGDEPDPQPDIDIPPQADGSPGSDDWDAETIVEMLEARGWALMNSARPPDFRLDLCRGYTPEGFADQVFHLHIVRPGDHDELYFRDWLRDHPRTCRQYETLKQDLLARYEHDRDAYTEAKTDFIRSVTLKARVAEFDR